MQGHQLNFVLLCMPATLLGYIDHASCLACPCGSWKLELACLPLNAEQTSRPSWKLL